MPELPIVERIEILEKKVEALETLPARVSAVELQLVQLRDEMHAEFLATREQLVAEIRAGDEHVMTTLRAEIRAGDESAITTLRAEIRAGDEETRRYMRVLHEEVISRLASIGEARGSRGKKGN